MLQAPADELNTCKFGSWTDSKVPRSAAHTRGAAEHRVIRPKWASAHAPVSNPRERTRMSRSAGATACSERLFMHCVTRDAAAEIVLRERLRDVRARGMTHAPCVRLRELRAKSQRRGRSIAQHVLV